MGRGERPQGPKGGGERGRRGERGEAESEGWSEGSDAISDVETEEDEWVLIPRARAKHARGKYKIDTRRESISYDREAKYNHE